MTSTWLVTTSDTPVTPVPLAVYVLWHPKFAEGAHLALAIERWLGGRTSDIRAMGLGVPVHFRSAAWRPEDRLEAPPDPTGPERGGGDGETPKGDVLADLHADRMAFRTRPIDLFRARWNVFVPLVDDHMVEDPAWQRDLREIADLATRTSKDKRYKPHALMIGFQATDHWARLDPEITRHKSYPLRRWDDDPVEARDDRLKRHTEKVCRLLTQAIVTQVVGEGALREVFLSHAKLDKEHGPGVAEQLRDVAAGYGQIRVFYDENSLIGGTDFTATMKGAAEDGAGFIAVMSDAYASRYWCRWEVEHARTPREVRAGSGVWTMRPTVVVDTLHRGWTRLVADLATVPAVRWRDGRAAEVFDVLFREALVQWVQREYATALSKAWRKKFTHRDIAFATWTPDPASLWSLVREAEGTKKPIRAIAVGPSMTIAYPGHGFLPTEEQRIERGIRGIDLRSFESVSDEIASANPPEESSPAPPQRAALPDPPWPRVSISAGDTADLLHLGYHDPDTTKVPPDARRDGAPPGGSVHLDDAVLRLCRALFGAGLGIAYGGNLRQDGTFNRVMLDAASAIIANPTRHGADGKHRTPPLGPDGQPWTPLENYVAAGLPFEVADRAPWVNVCRFFQVPTHGGKREGPISDAEKADALSHMRELVASRTKVGFALGGKVKGFTGIMPGVAEEVLAAWEATPAQRAPEERVRMVLIGAFGGVTRQIVRYVLGFTPTLPDCLTLDGQRKLGLIQARVGGDGLLKLRYADLAACLDAMKAVAAHPADTKLPTLGITVGQWRDLMTTDSMGTVRRAILRHIGPAVWEANP